MTRPQLDSQLDSFSALREAEKPELVDLTPIFDLLESDDSKPSVSIDFPPELFDAIEAARRELWTYDAKSLGGSKSRRDRQQVFEAVKIAQSVVHPTGRGLQPAVSIRDIARALEERDKEQGDGFQITPFRPDTLQKMKRFKKMFTDVTGTAEVNEESVNKYLKAAVVLALSSTQLKGKNAVPINQSNFTNNYLRPIYSLWYSQNENESNSNSDSQFPRALQRLIQRAHINTRQFLPLFRKRVSIDDEVARLLIRCCPIGSSYYFSFAFHLSLLVCCGKRGGVVQNLRYEDIIDVTELKGKKLTNRHYHIVILLRRRDKDRSSATQDVFQGKDDDTTFDLDSEVLSLVGCVDERETFDCVYHFGQLIKEKLGLNIQELSYYIETGKWKEDKRFRNKMFSYDSKLNINSILKITTGRTNLPEGITFTQ